MLVTVRSWIVHFEWYRTPRSSLPPGSARPRSMPSRPAVPRRCRRTKRTSYVRNELLTTKRVSDRTYQAIGDRFGERRVVDLLGIIAYYQMASMMLRTSISIRCRPACSRN